jgi:flavodoxin
MPLDMYRISQRNKFSGKSGIAGTPIKKGVYMKFRKDTKFSSFSSCWRVLTKGMVFFGLLGSTLVSLLPVSSANAASTDLTGKKTLIVYYSWGGNTRQIVDQIRKTIQADVFELKTVDPYPEEYRPTTVQAKREQETGYRPPLSTKIDNLDAYDVIIIGSPNWWGTVAMPVFTFLESYTLSGKTIAMYITHEGSRLGNSMDDLRKLCPSSTVLEGLAIRGGSVGSAQKDVDAWLRKIGLAK